MLVDEWLRGAYGKAGNGSGMETGNGKWKWKLEMEIQFLITCSMQNWSRGRPGNEARDDPNAALLVPTPNEAR